MVYLIHFEEKFHHTQHYIGFSYDHRFNKRINCHRKNKGARILTALNKKQIQWRVVRTWPDHDGNFERKLKKLKNAKKLCPICNQKIKIC